VNLGIWVSSRIWVSLGPAVETYVGNEGDIIAIAGGGNAVLPGDVRELARDVTV
jgi:hypothetical protein